MVPPLSPGTTLYPLWRRHGQMVANLSILRDNLVVRIQRWRWCWVFFDAGVQKISLLVPVLSIRSHRPSIPGLVKLVRRIVRTIRHDMVTHTVYYIASYHSNNPQPSHFTQVVWKSTTQVGCAVKDCSGIFPANYGVRLNFFYTHLLDGDLVCSSRTTTFVNIHPQEMLLGSLRVSSSSYFCCNLY